MATDKTIFLARNNHSKLSQPRRLKRPLFVTLMSILLLIAAVVSLGGGGYLAITAENDAASDAAPTPPPAPTGKPSQSSTQPWFAQETAQPANKQTEIDNEQNHAETSKKDRSAFARVSKTLSTALLTLVFAGVSLASARGMWTLQNWSRSLLMTALLLVMLYFLVSAMFAVSKEIFGGEHVLGLGDIFQAALKGLFQLLIICSIPAAITYGLRHYSYVFEETLGQKKFADALVRYILLVTAFSAIFIVFMIILFTMNEAWDSIEKVGLDTMLVGAVWRPGSIIGAKNAQFGLLPMVVGSILSTFGAIVLGVPLSLGAAILLAEVAPQTVRELVRPAIELLAGIPSVVYGLFGMVVLAPMIRGLGVSGYNTGFGLLNASIILAVMIIPTVTNIAEDAIRAVPGVYKQGSLALGATHWQTIWNVTLPAARSGIVAAIILGIGRALGETMALIMVIGNAIAVPERLSDNPLTLFLSTARTLTGNIAVEINYAAGEHRSALFFTGVLLFAMIFAVNSVARYLMREKVMS